MLSSREEGPVYYREIQKNAYLKRIPSDPPGKLRPLAHKKPPLKPMWTMFCVHNGRTPFLEQYPEAESPATLSHKPIWRACLNTARHVTASVKPHVGEEYDFLIDTDQGSVRMLAPDWESMQDWVTTLRNKLHELKIIQKGENVYCSPPAAAVPRAAARDPTSPLPPTPPVPPDRVPGIELTTPLPRSQPEITESVSLEQAEPEVDISNWDTPFNSLPSTSVPSISVPSTSQPSTSQATSEGKEKKIEKKNVAKICGQNICLDDSILKRRENTGSTDSDEEFFAEIDKISESVENLSADSQSLKTSVQTTEQVSIVRLEQRALDAERNQTSDSRERKQDSDRSTHTKLPQPNTMGQTDPETISCESNEPREYKQRMVVNDKSAGRTVSANESRNQATNITVIQVSNKPPHTAIPVLGPETNVFDFCFQQNLPVNNNDQTDPRNDVTVNCTPSSTPNRTGKETFVNIVNTEVNVTENGYGTVFDKDGDYGHLSLTTTVNLTGPKKAEGIYEKLCLASTSVRHPSPLPVRRIRNTDVHRKSSLPNLDMSSESTYEYLFPSPSITSTEQNFVITSNNDERLNNNRLIDRNRSNKDNQVPTRLEKQNLISTRNSPVTGEYNTRVNLNSQAINLSNVSTQPINVSNQPTPVANPPITLPNQQSNVSSQPAVPSSQHNVSNATVQRRNLVERSQSQNAYDTSPRLRELIRRQHCSPKREGKNDKSEPAKPIWKRGLTELSLLSKLRFGQKRHESPTRQDGENDRTAPTGKALHRSRADGRYDNARRRSSSLSNGQPPPLSPPAPTTPLRLRQAASLAAEQRRGAAVVATLPARDPPLFVSYEKQVWIAWWGHGGSRVGGRAGDRVAALRGTAPRDANHARQLVKSSPKHTVDILFHRVPLGKIYVLNKRDLESIGMKLDSECNIASVEPQSPAARAGIPPSHGRWAVTEVNNRPINLIKGGDEEMHRLSVHGCEVSVLVQPSALVKKIRSAVKASRPLLSIR